MKHLDSLELEPLFSVQQRYAIGGLVLAQGGDAAMVDMALGLAKAFKTHPGFEGFFVSIEGKTTAGLPLLRPILQLLQAAPEARTMLTLIYRPKPELGQLSTALFLLSALDVGLCLDLKDLSAEALRQAADLPAHAVRLDADLLCGGATGYVEDLCLIAARRELKLIAWNVRQRAQLEHLRDLGFQYIHGSLFGQPMKLSGFSGHGGMVPAEEGITYE